MPGPLRPLTRLRVLLMMPGKTIAASMIRGIPAIGHKILNRVSNRISSMNRNAYRI
jgi:hypothetical protein